MEITIRLHRKFSSRVDRARVKKIARKTLRAEKANAALTIYVTTNAEMRALNRDFHATDAPTDVLSFPADGRSVERSYIGDIAISYDTARVQARDAGWRIADELDLLAVHGILHLLGYDDLTPRKRARMWKRQKAILGRVAGDE
ncbi:MAG: rRNA maturation RNase YbeY [Chloroflexi bacterium]|nr:rRNA maturation RNase YbeY [Chloroflexota bacterium]